MSVKFRNNCIAVLIVVLVLCVLSTVGHTFVPVAAKLIGGEAARRASVNAIAWTMRAIGGGGGGQGVAVGTVLRASSGAQTLRFGTSTVLTGGLVVMLAKHSAKLAGLRVPGDPVPLQPYQVGTYVHPTNEFYVIIPPELHRPNEGWATVIDIRTQGSPFWTPCQTNDYMVPHWNYYSFLGVMQHYMEKSTEGCPEGRWKYQVRDYQRVGTIFPWNPENYQAFEPDPHDPGIYDVWGNPITPEQADRIARDALNSPWPADVPKPQINLVINPTDSQVQTQLQEAKSDAGTGALTVAETGTLLNVRNTPDPAQYELVWRSDVGGKVESQIVPEEIAQAIIDALAEAGAEPLPGAEEVIGTETTTRTNPDGTTTTTAVTTVRDPVTGRVTQTVTETTTNPHTGQQTTTEVETEVTPLPEHLPFPDIPPFDASIDVPEKVPIPWLEWRSMVPFLDVWEQSGVEASDGDCFLVADFGQFGEVTLDFCPYGQHLAWMGNFIYAVALLLGVRLIITGRE